MNCLFIGGCADGRWIDILSGSSIFRVPHFNGYDTYYVSRLAGSDGGVFTVYAERKLSDSDIMRYLVTHYRPVEEKAISA